MATGEWPGEGRARRYRVRFRCPETGHEYMVASLYGPEKAVAIATRRHLHLFDREDDMRGPIIEVTLEEVGPIAQDNSGVLAPERGDLVDRWEW